MLHGDPYMYPKKHLSFFVLFISLLVVFTAHSFAWSPPSNSPLGNGDHPRLMFISEDFRSTNPTAHGITVGEMRIKLMSASYSSAFQSFINLMDGSATYDASPASKVDSRDVLNVTADAVNYAFLAILDPENSAWSGSGITFGHTKAQYVTKAKEHAQYISEQLQSNISYWNEMYTFYHSGSYNAGFPNMALAIVNDWLNSELTLAEKQNLADGIISSYTGRSSITLLASYKHFGRAYHGSGVIGFYGDSLGDSYSTTFQTILDNTYNNWIRSFVDMTDMIYGGGSNHPEGSEYDEMALMNMSVFMNAFCTATNTNYYNTANTLRNHPYYTLYRILPLKLGNRWRRQMLDDTGGESLTGIDLEWGRKEIYWKSWINNLPSDEASLAKWTKETFYTEEAYSRTRTQGVLFEFFQGNTSVVAKSPTTLNLPLSKDVGMGHYIMRTGFSSESDSMVTFFAPRWHVNDGGHAHRDMASFRIVKHGRLAITRQIAKGDYPNNVYTTQRSLVNNVIGVLKPGESNAYGHNVMGYRDSMASSDLFTTDNGFQEGGIHHVGDVLRDDLEGTLYDYIDYDYSKSWDSSKVDYAEREFVYLRSDGGANDEYVVVFDRINSVDPSYAKYWLLHSNFEPDLLNEAGEVITMTAENYPNDPDSTGGRWVNVASSPTNENIIQLTNEYENAHGRLLNKTLLPATFQINKVGGPNHYWEDANGKSIETPSSLSDYLCNEVGSYTMQVQSLTGEQYDTFLNVMQFGDSNSLSEMTEIVKVDSAVMVGAHIKDSTTNRVVMFSSSKNQQVTAPEISYQIAATSALTRHHLFGMLPNTSYEVIVNGEKNTVESNASGVILFSTGGVIIPSIETITIQ